MKHLFHKTMTIACGAVLAIALILPTAAISAGLPDLVPLAKQTAHAVVNISTEKAVSGGIGGFPSDMFQGLPPGFEQFFNQFGNFGKQGQPRMQKSLGTGFIISRDGYIVTNNHVVANADVVHVNLEGAADSDQALTATIIGTDPDTDLALLKIDARKSLPYLEFGNSDTAEVGEWVLAIGNPFGLGHTVTQGILSGKGRDIKNGPADSLAPAFLQTDASINPGNSGGPLINMDGKVIGINTAIIASGQGIGFAIPSNNAKRIVEQLKQDKHVSRGWIGVSIQKVDQHTANALGLSRPQGALIASIVKGEPADKAGLQEGDVILAVNGTDMKDNEAVLHAIAEQTPGSTVVLTVWRDNRKETVKVKLGDRSSATGTKTLTPEKMKPLLGLSARSLTADESSQLGLRSGIGLLVTKVLNDGPAAEAGLKRGDILLSANRKPLRNDRDLAHIIADNAKRGAVMLQIWRQGHTFFRSVPFSTSSKQDN